jgi:Leucine-rich repeat (LRR) protein
LSDVLLSVQCCADAELSCANARVTGIGLSKHQLRGSLPEQLGSLGALRSLKLHDNFLTGTFPSSLGKLHWLQELQLSHNQFAMQARADLSKMLGGMLQLQTLDLGMSNEV